MIITRTPFRVSFAGGGSDLEAYYAEEPGVVLSTAIDKYMYLTVMKRFGDNFRISYSRTEIVDRVDEIEHGIVRSCLQELNVTGGLEIVSIADLPARTGLGSSSSFTVGLLHALHACHGRMVSAERLAREACRIEIERLREPIGKQDQYIAAYGGLQLIQFNPDGSVFVDPVICSGDVREALNRRLLLFFTGVKRDARDLLARQRAGMAAKRAVLRRMCELARRGADILASGAPLEQFGMLLDEAWHAKRSLDPAVSTPDIDRLYEAGKTAGALGGKLLGAGGGGFLLFYCEPRRQHRLREALAELTEVPFRLDPQGSKIIYVGDERALATAAPERAVAASRV